MRNQHIKKAVYGTITRLAEPILALVDYIMNGLRKHVIQYNVYN